MNVVYKIRRRSDGWYSKGGVYAFFSKYGKTWNTIGHLKRHLAQMTKERQLACYADCEIVEYEEQDVERQTIGEFLGYEG